MGLIEHTILFFLSLGVFVGSAFHAGGSLEWFHWLFITFSILGMGKSISYCVPNDRSLPE